MRRFLRFLSLSPVVVQEPVFNGRPAGPGQGSDPDVALEQVPQTGLGSRVDSLLLFVHQEAHEQGINAVRFSCTSDLLATGGTDRVIKLWDVRAGTFPSSSSSSLCVHVTRRCDLTDDVIRLADSQSDAGRRHGGHHLRRVQPHGKAEVQELFPGQFQVP